ncbi:9119_t:CDS:1, partial [Ambispora gerdemannii]
YETKSQTFYHYDTLKGANYYYVKPLVSELCQQIQQTNNIKLTDYLIPQHHIQQKNTCDCGIAVIALIQKISEQYSTLSPQQYVGNLSLGQLDFAQQRQELRTEYLTENGTN